MTDSIKKRKRLKYRPWFLSRSATPVSSKHMDLPSFCVQAQDAQVAIESQLSDVQTNRDDGTLPNTLVAPDQKYINEMFTKHFHHLQRERRTQLVMAEKARSKKSQCKVASSAMAISQKISSHSQEDHAYANNDNTCSDDENDADEESRAIERLMDELCGLEYDSQTSSNADLNNISMTDLQKALIEIKSKLYKPQLEMLMPRNLSGIDYRRVCETGIPKFQHPDSSHSVNLERRQDAVLNITFYTANIRPLTKSQEFQVYAGSKIIDLCQKLYCVADEFNNESQARKANAFLRIEGIIYTKGTVANNYPQFEHKEMGELRWSDLPIRVNFPYVYCHQDDCFHVLMISQVQMYNPHIHSRIPRQVFQRIPKRQMCKYCKEMSASKLVTRCELMDNIPAVFCNQCFKEFCSGSNVEYYDIPSDLPPNILLC